MALPWRDYKGYLMERYGRPVYRIGLDGGFSCPNRDSAREGGCIYCDARGSSAVYQRQDESAYRRGSSFVQDIDARIPRVSFRSIAERKTSLSRQIERGVAFLDSRYPASARSIYFQAYTGTYDEPGVLRELYRHALDSGNYEELIVSTRCDCLPDATIDVLTSFQDRVRTVWVELGLQSGNDETLRWIGRGHTVQCFLDACTRLHAAHLPICAHVILGFPHEDDAAVLRTAEVIARSGVQALKIHNLHVVAGTRLCEQYLREGFEVSDMQRHLHECELLLRHIPAEVVIQRFLSDTPSHRLAAPRDFGDKNTFLALLRERMEQAGTRQGDLR